MASVPASEFQKNFGEWHERIYQGPVEITRYGRPTAYLVSAEMFQQLWERFRVNMPVEELSIGEIEAIMQAEVTGDQPYNLDDLPDEPAEPR
ncbi:prevent-host-death family protein [Rhizobium rosettiformans]|jgi:prevent-host-death family protein|uniref:Antitoxin n=2 Tax=Rhizobium rosettiformans TaxID=1368430 RepID=A0A4S8PPX0_9HYPH|nr:type II toxin-antitoxin system prevent-host-death family antitoxin [Rhizobium rosettiformans]MBB5277857.1 prevent-host-death family protein [Rhizobium rosettiformans]THV33017.1 type II toxin-antitoxin system Phd/YefM family antitoxin [Rhizobium rosettiformans W3]